MANDSGSGKHKNYNRRVKMYVDAVKAGASAPPDGAIAPHSKGGRKKNKTTGGGGDVPF